MRVHFMKIMMRKSCSSNQHHCLMYVDTIDVEEPTIVDYAGMDREQDDSISMISFGSLSTLPIFNDRDDDTTSVISFGSVCTLPIFACNLS